MNQTDFEALVERIRQETVKTLVMKGREYAGNADRLANFKRGAALTGVEPLTVLFIYMSKHYDAFATYVKDLQSNQEMPVLSEPIEGRLMDLINYCILAWALVEEGNKMCSRQAERVVSSEEHPFLDNPPKKVEVRSTGAVVSILDGQEADEFLLAVNRRVDKDPAVMVFRGAQIAYWRYEGETDWKVA